MDSSSSKVQVNKGKAPAQPPQSQRNEALGDLMRMHYWATALMDQGKLAEATEMSRKVLEMSRRVLGPEHPDSLSRMFDLGLVLHAGERFGDAEHVLQQLLPLREKVLGPSHPDTIAVMCSICEELFNLRKYEEARELLEEDLLRCKEAFGLDHQLTIGMLRNMGNVYIMQDKLQDACSVYRTALDVSERVLGEAHQTTLGIRYNLQETQKQDNMCETQDQPVDSIWVRQFLALKHSLPLPADPFGTTRSMTTSQLLDKYQSVSGFTSAGPEVAAAVSLRLGETTRHTISAPFIMPSSYNIEAESTAVSGPSQNHTPETAV